MAQEADNIEWAQSIAVDVEAIGPDQLSAWRAFLRAHSTMLRRIGQDLDEAGLPPLAWYDVLAALRDAPEQRMKQVELASQVLLSHSGISRLLDRIEARGLIERTSCPNDRRSFHVVLTDSGLDMLDRMWPVYARGIAEDFLPALGDKNAEEIRAALEAIAGTCERVQAESSEGATTVSPTAASEAEDARQTGETSPGDKPPGERSSAATV